MLLGPLVSPRVLRLLGYQGLSMLTGCQYYLSEELHLVDELLTVQLRKGVCDGKKIDYISSLECILIVCHIMRWECKKGVLKRSQLMNFLLVFTTNNNRWYSKIKMFRNNVIWWLNYKLIKCYYNCSHSL